MKRYVTFLAQFPNLEKNYSGMFLSYVLYQIPKTKRKKVMDMITRANLTSRVSAGKKYGINGKPEGSFHRPLRKELTHGRTRQIRG
jgi:hypothetical protein